MDVSQRKRKSTDF
jgi:hypothetical protein